MAGMALTIVIVFGVPIGLYFGLRKRLGLKATPVFVGAAIFVAFALVLEPSLHRVVLRPAADGTIGLMSSHPGLYVLYGVLAAGVFEETGRLVGFTMIRNRFQGARTAVAYGIGHGGCEAILLAGLTMISNLAVSIMINSGSTVSASVVDALTKAPSYMFSLSGVERLIAITAQLALSVVVWTAVTQRRWRWLFPVAIGLHAVTDVPSGLYQVGVLGYGVTLGLTAVVTVLVAAFGAHLLRQALTDEKAAAQQAATAGVFDPRQPIVLNG
ncbi:MAG: YhfC family intramembrane metalloprotease, partial [Propionibacteriaceae bacterium]|nr:YhfC family intramembrane metalloprotease [Propionibacteriaceae bacterium]